MFIWNTGRNVSCDVVDLHCDFFGALDPDPDCGIFKKLIQIVILNLCIRNRIVILNELNEYKIYIRDMLELET